MMEKIDRILSEMESKIEYVRENHPDANDFDSKAEYESASWSYQQGHVISINDCREILQHIFDLKLKMSWNRTSPGVLLPEFSQPVLLAERNDDGEQVVYPGYLNQMTSSKSGTQLEWLTYDHQRCNPTHWMPFPEPPK